jgi:hypothetical protein
MARHQSAGQRFCIFKHAGCTFDLDEIATIVFGLKHREIGRPTGINVSSSAFEIATGDLTINYREGTRPAHRSGRLRLEQCAAAWCPCWSRRRLVLRRSHRWDDHIGKKR